MSVKEKKDKPKDFIGVAVIMSAQDRVGYMRGDVIDILDGDQDPGQGVWDDLILLNPIFKLVYLHEKTKLDLEQMLEEFFVIGYKYAIAKRKYSFDIEDSKLKDKTEWKKTDIDGKIKTKVEPEADQPDEIVIP